MPKGIWVLGFGSLLMDTSSELVHSLLPIFMATVLGASMATIGVIEGVAEATASITRVFSGGLSDYLRKRKPLVVLGYGLSAVTKLVFPLASTLWWVFSARFVDRVGKGIRGAPRDALIADIVQPAQRGKAYGLRQALDSIGALLGPLLAVACMAWLANNIRAVLWVAAVPGFLAVLLLLVAVREPETPGRPVDTPRRVVLAALRQLHVRYWYVVALGAIFTLARFSEAFLILRGRDVGMGLGSTPLIMVAMNVVYAALAYPAGVAADRLSARTLLILGLVVLLIADIVLALADSPPLALGGAVLWGAHMALTQGLLSKLVADTAPGPLRGTAFGIFNLVSGVSLLLASVVAGALWEKFGAPATFVAGAAFAALAALGLLFYRPKTFPPPS
ncbi:MFS transporter [Rhodanobacter ginsengisoli]|uniref:MFS transporter n=1 Tax=Rhodanobacter ginsengisoli TaxID=418646 RepID=A0ABW0QLN9_9GAMM